MKKTIYLLLALIISTTFISSCASQKTLNAETASVEKKEVTVSKKSKVCKRARTGSRLKRC
ncbi:MAG: hypothetical protein COA86_01135 [Kangiella sp.]|nr:MAG: hypothetical protein COA86_01135 [Kangiella sp.]